MAVKRFDIEGIGAAVIYKRKGTKAMKLSVSHSGEIKVVIPNWVPYKAAISFIKSKQNWINSQLQKVPALKFYNGTEIGRGHRLIICNDESAKIRTRIKGIEAKIFVNSTNLYSEEFQKVAYKLCLKALKIQTEEMVLSRLKNLAEDNNFDYRNLKAKHLKARWGSCNQSKDITINIFLVQLPIELMDYVMLHELVHTKVMHHQKNFWDMLEKYVPDLKKKKKEIKNYKPELELKPPDLLEYV